MILPFCLSPEIFKMTSKVWATITSIFTYRTKALKEVVGFSVFTRCILLSFFNCSKQYAWNHTYFSNPKSKRKPEDSSKEPERWHYTSLYLLVSCALSTPNHVTSQPNMFYPIVSVMG